MSGKEQTVRGIVSTRFVNRGSARYVVKMSFPDLNMDTQLTVPFDYEAPMSGKRWAAVQEAVARIFKGRGFDVEVLNAYWPTEAKVRMTVKATVV